MGPRFASTRLDLRVASAGSRQGSLVTPGGAPMQPGSAADEAARAGAAPRSVIGVTGGRPSLSEVKDDIDFYSYNVKRELTRSPARSVRFPGYQSSS